MKRRQVVGSADWPWSFCSFEDTLSFSVSRAMLRFVLKPYWCLQLVQYRWTAMFNCLTFSSLEESIYFTWRPSIEYWYGGQPLVTQSTQTKIGFASHLFLLEPFKRDTRVRTCLIGALLISVDSATTELKILLYAQPDLGTDRVYGRRILPSVQIFCIWHYARDP